ncbi:MAG: HAD hydrolase-like protein [Spirochaetota bacterium]
MTCLAFDIDGTIFDCGDIIVEAFERTIAIMIERNPKDIKMPSREEIISTLGIPTDAIFQKLFPYLETIEQKQMTDLCTDVLAEMINNGGGYIYENAYPTIEKFHKEGYRLFAASNGKLEYIEAILHTSGLAGFFIKPIIVLNEIITNKTGILKQYKDKISGHDLFIMIGDRSSDRLAAEENNLPFIGCSFGHAVNELEGAEWIADNFKVIYDLVKNIEKQYTK